MIKVLYISLLIASTYLMAYESEVDEKTAFEMLLFKTGVTSLSKDFEIEKENIENNTQEIENLKKNVKYLLEENMKLKLGIKDSSLEDENKILKAQLEELQKQLNNKQEKVIVNKNESKFIEAVISDLIASSVIAPYPNSKKATYYNKGDILQIEFCNRYGWCKIAQKKEYIAKYKIYFTKD
jgi:regulator of replication initiation timing